MPPRSLANRTPTDGSPTRNSRALKSSGGGCVPSVLLSGHHARVERWRRAQSLHRTQRRRPDLLVGQALSAEERRLMDEIPPCDV